MPPDALDDSARWARVSDVFDVVADLPVAERPAALDRLCRDADGHPEADLRAEVESLLAADADATLSTRSLRPVESVAAAALLTDGVVVGERIGPWRVLRELGRGGMGRVDLVERADGVYDQRAALKRLGLAAADRVRQFIRERQILARLEHPGISRLLDGGVTDDGTPYLVMEHVEGEPITTAADARGLSVSDRVRLFLQVCDAVGYAHRHLVVHRDLKPSNVFVSEDGGVKLLDFGIARLLDDEADGGVRTALPALTPAYAAPEQVAGGAITTATDVYALGVLLYELLSGQRPYEIEHPTLSGIVQAVVETRHRPPSAVTRDEARQRALRGDLDTVVMKALDKEPERRYGSADDFGADLRRVLEGRPVEARAPTAAYRARRFVGRHRTGVVLSALVVLAAGVGLVSTLWQARQARIEAATSSATAAFLGDLFRGADPTAAPTDTLSALDLLDRGARRLDGGLADQPAVRADLYAVIGDAYLGLGRPDSAAAFARRVLAVTGPSGVARDAVAAVRARVLLARATFPTDPEAAAAEFEQAVAAARASGDDAVLLDALEAQGDLVGSQVLSPDETVAVFEEAMALCRRLEGDDSPRLGRILAMFAGKAASAHQHGRIEGLLRDALARLPADEAPYDRSGVLLELAKMLHATGQPEEAVARADEALAIRRRLLAPGDPRIGHALGTRASIGGGGPIQSEADAREALAIAERHADGAGEIEALDGLGAALTSQDRMDEAVEVYRRRFVRAGEVYGAEGTRYPAASGTYARSLYQAGRFAEASRAWETSLELTTSAFGPESAVVMSSLLEAGWSAEAAGQDARAAAYYERAYTGSRALSETSRTRASAALWLGKARLDSGRSPEAVSLLREALAVREVLDRPTASGETGDGMRAQALLGEALMESGEETEGRRLVEQALSVLADVFGPDHPATRRARAVLRR